MQLEAMKRNQLFNLFALAGALLLAVGLAAGLAARATAATPLAAAAIAALIAAILLLGGRRHLFSQIGRAHV